jgi:hypothetical protein
MWPSRSMTTTDGRYRELSISTSAGGPSPVTIAPVVNEVPKSMPSDQPEPLIGLRSLPRSRSRSP